MTHHSFLLVQCRLKFNSKDNNIELENAHSLSVIPAIKRISIMVECKAKLEMHQMQ